jgi:hypothetical protein
MEGSGVQVISPEHVGEILTADSEVWVANPYHLTDITKFLSKYPIEVRAPVSA